MIEVEKLCVRVGAFSLTDVSFTIESGDYAVLMGKTGCGKTTLLESICGLVSVVSGQIRLMGEDVTHWKAARRGIGFVPQDGALFSTMTVYDQLAFALQIRKHSKQEIDTRVHHLAEVLNIEPLLQRYPVGLSGGEQQRVALGRALSFNPHVLCMDEPLSALDEETKNEMYQLFKSIREEYHVTTLHITHSMQEASILADKILVLKEGTINCLSPSDWEAGQVQNAFSLSGNSSHASLRTWS